MSLVPFSYLSLNELDSKEDNNRIKYFYINDKVIKIKELHEKGIGGKFWDCVSNNISFNKIFNSQ